MRIIKDNILKEIIIMNIRHTRERERERLIKEIIFKDERLKDPSNVSMTVSKRF
jgi:hypothetical protein